MEEHNCRVCGFFSEDAIRDKDNNPSYEICPCCGVEFGNEDYTKESIISYRSEWIKKGYPWFAPKFKPSEWSIEIQMQNIPKAFF